MKDVNFNLHILFYTEGLPFTGAPIERQGLGGSESALWFMAREMKRLGHVVDVICNCPHPGVYEGVNYWDKSQVRQLLTSREWDVVIVSRFAAFLSLQMKVRQRWLWAHDMPSGLGRQIATAMYNVDQMVALSDFHKEAYITEVPDLETKIWKSRNGVDLSLIEKGQEVKRRPKHLVYLSQPVRGLDVLLQDIWPRLLKQDPELTLSICGYSVQGLGMDARMQQYYEFCRQLIERSPQVTAHGSLAKLDLYRLLHSAALTVYPCTFPEISCIAALESMASGTPIVTTNDFALKETVPYEKVAGQPRTEEYTHNFVQMTMQLLSNPMLYRRRQKEGLEWVKQYNYRIIAKEWESRMYQLFRERHDGYALRVAEGLLFDSDVMAAIDAAEVDHLPSVIREGKRILEEHHTKPDLYAVSGEKVARYDWDLGARNERFDHLAQLIPPVKRALDIGCGNGGFLGRLLQQRPEVTAVGVDFSPANIQIAENMAREFGVSDRVRFICVDVDASLSGVLQSLGEVPFDVVVAAEILEHIPQTQPFVEKLEQCVKANGFVFLTVPSGPWESYSYNRPIDQPVHFHVHHFEMRDLYELFDKKKDFTLQHIPHSVGFRGELLGWWFVNYRVTSAETGKVNYHRKRLTARPRQTIAACMIVKNEEARLRQCLGAIIPIVDEIWVYDTGSTDGTRAIVESYMGNHHPRVEWREISSDPDGDGLPNFGTWRNWSTSETEADWILWIDADEELLNGQCLRKYVTPESLFNAYVIRQNHLSLNTVNPMPPDVPQRLFRNHRNYFFVGAIHEQVEQSRNVAIEPALQLGDVDIAHYGYMTAYTTRKKCIDRNLAVLIKDRKLHPFRDVGPLLTMRDYLNLAQLMLEDNNGRMNEKILEYIRNSCRIYWQEYQDPKNKYHEYARRFYDPALRALGQSQLPAEEGWGMPFQVRYQCAVGVGGLDDRTIRPVEGQWFAHPDELVDFLKNESDGLKKAIFDHWKASGFRGEFQEHAALPAPPEDILKVG